jgi:hypothetical protein
MFWTISRRFLGKYIKMSRQIEERNAEQFSCKEAISKSFKKIENK